MRIRWLLAIVGLMSVSGVFASQVYGARPMDQIDHVETNKEHFVNRALKSARLNPKIVPSVSSGLAILKYEDAHILSAYRPTQAKYTTQTNSLETIGDAAHLRAASLATFSKKLAHLKDHSRRDPVRILHIGGRSLSSDQFANRMRFQLGVDFSNAGQGNLLRDLKDNKAHRIGVSYDAKGKVHFASLSKGDKGAFGLSGIRFQLLELGSEFSVHTKIDPFEWVEFTVLSGPRQGILSYEIGGLTQKVSLLASDENVKRIRVDASGEDIRFASLKGQVQLLSIRAGYKLAGVQYETIALTPPSHDLFHNADRDYAAQDLTYARPDLVVLSLGDELLDNDKRSLAALNKRWNRVLRQIKRSAPTAPIVILGPHDRGIAKKLRQQNDTASKVVSSPCPAPSLLKPKRLMARELALIHQASFWDWSAAMGGQCSISKWRTAVPPLVEQDLQTLTPNGEQYSAQLFAQWLLHVDNQQLAGKVGR